MMRARNEILAATSQYAAIKLECPDHIEVLYGQDQVIMTRNYRAKQKRFVLTRSTLASPFGPKVITFMEAAVLC